MDFDAFFVTSLSAATLMAFTKPISTVPISTLPIATVQHPVLHHSALDGALALCPLCSAGHRRISTRTLPLSTRLSLSKYSLFIQRELGVTSDTVRSGSRASTAVDVSSHLPGSPAAGEHFLAVKESVGNYWNPCRILEFPRSRGSNTSVWSFDSLVYLQIHFNFNDFLIPSGRSAALSSEQWTHQFLKAKSPFHFAKSYGFSRSFHFSDSFKLKTPTTRRTSLVLFVNIWRCWTADKAL